MMGIDFSLMWRLLAFTAITVVIVELAMWSFKKARKRVGPLNIKKVLGYPFVGSYFAFTANQGISTCVNFPKAYGNLIELYMFGQRCFMITDAELCKDVLRKRPKYFRRLKTLDYFAEKMGLEDGLFFTHSKTWSKMRKLTAPSFSHHNLTLKFRSIVKVIVDWVKKLEDISMKLPDNSADMVTYAGDLTKSIITVVAVGCDPAEPHCSYFFEPQSYQDIKDIMDFGMQSTLFLLPRWLWKWLGNYKSELRAQNANERFSNACRGIIDYRRRLLTNGTAKTTLLDHMLARHDPTIGSNAAEVVPNYNEDDFQIGSITDDELIANLKTFYIAGSETTAITIAWICYYFTVYPSVLTKVRDELITMIFQSVEPPTMELALSRLVELLTPDSMYELQYTIAVVKETLRLMPPAIYLMLQLEDELEEDAVVLRNGLVVKKEDIVILNIEGLHRQEDIFEYADSFIPERWLTKDPVKLSAMEQNYLPFGSGPRMCPGMILAYQEAICTAACLAYAFPRMTLACPEEDICRISRFTATPNQMPLFLHPISFASTSAIGSARISDKSKAPVSCRL